MKAVNVCVYQTMQINSTNVITYEPYDRCGTSGSVSGNTVTVVVSGDYTSSDNVSVSSQSIGIGKNTIQGDKYKLWNGKQQEIWLIGGSS